MTCADPCVLENRSHLAGRLIGGYTESGEDLDLRTAFAGWSARLLVAAMVIGYGAVSCGSDSKGGGTGLVGTGATCSSGMQCSTLEDCPGIGCSCPGIRFPVTIKTCNGGCCPASCAEACPSSGSGGSGGSSGDDGGADSGDPNFLAACPMGTYDIDVDWMLDMAANSGIVGTISLPADVAAGSATQLVIDKAGPGYTATQIAGSFVTQAGVTEVKYRLRKLPDGNFYLRFRVDQTGNGMFGDSGDFEGYWGGSVAMPIASKADAPVFHIIEQCRINADFGVGAVP